MLSKPVLKAVPGIRGWAVRHGLCPHRAYRLVREIVSKHDQETCREGRGWGAEGYYRRPPWAGLKSAKDSFSKFREKQSGLLSKVGGEGGSGGGVGELGLHALRGGNMKASVESWGGPAPNCNGQEQQTRLGSTHSGFWSFSQKLWKAIQGYRVMRFAFSKIH